MQKVLLYSILIVRKSPVFSSRLNVSLFQMDVSLRWLWIHGSKNRWRKNKFWAQHVSLNEHNCFQFGLCESLLLKRYWVERRGTPANHSHWTYLSNGCTGCRRWSSMASACRAWWRERWSRGCHTKHLCGMRSPLARKHRRWRRRRRRTWKPVETFSYTYT